MARNASSLLILSAACAYTAKDEWFKGHKRRAYEEAVQAREMLILAMIEMDREMEKP